MALTPYRGDSTGRSSPSRRVIASTIFLVHSDEVGWTALRAILHNMPDVQIVGDVASASEATRLAAAYQPDVILTALLLAEGCALPLLRELRQNHCPASRIVVFASRIDPNTPLACAELLIEGYLLWSELSVELLCNCLTTLLSGDIFLASPAVATAFVATLCPPEPPAQFTPREWRVLKWLAEGWTHKQIAQAERISRRTVQDEVNSLKAKLNASDLFVLGFKAARLGRIR